VAKTCPSCGYNPIGPFIDNCPICAEPVRHVRSDARGPGQPGKLPLKWIIGGVVIVALVLVGFWARGSRPQRAAFDNRDKSAERAKAQMEAQRRTRTVVVSAAELLKDFQSDPSADQKYKGKYLEVSGFVGRVGTDGDDIPFVILHSGDDNAALKIECFFDDADKNDEARIMRLRKSQTITVRGEYSGRVSNVQLKDCVLAK
jgi:hypothetical protein